MSIALDDLRSGDRRALAQAITLVESTRTDHRAEAEALLQAALPQTGKAIRIGISGIPGVGKSTFIEALGEHVIAAGHKVAVLAIDPSSKRTGGSIMGDKTRMSALAHNPSAYIRPSSTGGALGGVARRTREAMLICEAAGFDIVIVETVGVGQSETEVADMVDCFLLLLPPAGGDELQGIKKGIVELADLLVVNKADGDLLPAAQRAKAEYGGALRLLARASAHLTPKIELCSALERTGIDAVWNQIEAFMQAAREDGEIARRRAHQAVAWLWKQVEDELMASFLGHPGVESQRKALEEKVRNLELTPSAAASELMRAFLGKKA